MNLHYLSLAVLTIGIVGFAIYFKIKRRKTRKQAEKYADKILDRWEKEGKLNPKDGKFSEQKPPYN